MKKLALVLTFAMLLSMCAFTGSAEGAYNEAPMLAQRVEAGELPRWKSACPKIPGSPTKFWMNIWTMNAAITAAPCG